MGASRKGVPFQSSLENKQLVLTALAFFFFFASLALVMITLNSTNIQQMATRRPSLYMALGG